MSQGGGHRREKKKSLRKRLGKKNGWNASKIARKHPGSDKKLCSGKPATTPVALYERSAERTSTEAPKNTQRTSQD